jgi:hypothetical protein
MAGGWLDKIKDFAKGNPQQAETAIDKVEEVLDEKTGGKYAEQVDQGADALRDQLGLPREEASVPAPTPEPAPAPTPEPAPAPTPEPAPAPTPEPAPAPTPEPSPQPSDPAPVPEEPSQDRPPFDAPSETIPDVKPGGASADPQAGDGSTDDASGPEKQLPPFGSA